MLSCHFIQICDLSSILCKWSNKHVTHNAWACLIVIDILSQYIHASIIDETLMKIKQVKWFWKNLIQWTTIRKKSSQIFSPNGPFVMQCRWGKHINKLFKHIMSNLYEILMIKNLQVSYDKVS